MIFNRLPALLVSSAAIALCTAASAQDAPIVQPGKPGEQSRVITAEDATVMTSTSYAPADVTFMQHMIHHHAQALQMAALVEGRSENSDIAEIAERIRKTQDSEIGFMTGWLTERGESAPDPAEHSGHDMSTMMPGMLSAAQMSELADTDGAEFDATFLRLMIEHHEGAVTMVKNLLKQPGTAYDPALYEFTSEIVSDQSAEIARMNIALADLSTDPRATLAAGFRDAEQAAWNVELIASLAKPTGFFDPENPAGLRIELPAEEGEEEDEDAEPRYASRGPLLDFGNTDMAFADDVLIVGNYHGFNIYRLAEDGSPGLVSSVVCPGGQGDVSIVGDLLVTSVEQNLGRVDCGTQGITEDVSEDRLRGLRIFDISDLTRPRQVGVVQTCRGSHTHSVVTLPGADNTMVVYNSGTAGVREEEELAGCIGDIAGDGRTALFSIDVIEIPIDNPSAARIVDSPRIFADEDGNIAGLWRGGDHGDDTQRTSVTDQCHDITVFPSKQIAAGACSGNGIVLDISNPRAPKRIDAVVDKGFAYWHSATFNNDGTKVLFTDEWGGGVQPRCQASDPMDWGANAIYDIVSDKLERRGTYKLPAPQGKRENCVAHNGSIVPVPGRDIMVQAWYQGGLSILDFTDSSNPVEIAYFDRGPINDKQTIVGGFWSAYFHQGAIYASEITRGLDVLTLQPSDYLSANEIAAAALAEGEGVFNPQRQTPVTWPAVPVVAQAYLDQLERSGALEGDTLSGMRGWVSRAEAALDAGEQDTGVIRALTDSAAYARSADADVRDKARMVALAKTLDGIAASLR